MFVTHDLIGQRSGLLCGTYLEMRFSQAAAVAETITTLRISKKIHLFKKKATNII